MYMIIGLTRTDRQNDYLPAMDGWKLGAAQDAFGLHVPDLPGTGSQWAEAVFIATNAPEQVIQESPLATAVFEAIKAWLDNWQARRPVTPTTFRSLCVGDTVLVGGALWSCEKSGFRLRTAVLLEGQTTLPDPEGCQF